MIKRLPDNIIAKIAAGEVITTPVSIVKELLENSLDAKSTEIEIHVSKNFDSIEIQDNGCGIQEDDLKNLCKRHYTSKFPGVLHEVSTYGFRGEALFSISNCSKIKVFTKCADQNLGFVVTYEDEIFPKRMAMGNGTRISVSDIFHNNNFRKETLQKKKTLLDEIYYVVNFYCIANPTKTIKLFYEEKLNNSSILLVKKATSTDHLSSEVIDEMNIENSMLGTKVEMLENLYNIKSQLQTLRDDNFCAIFSNTTLNSRQYHFTMFVNNRLVINTDLKSRLKNLYKTFLPASKFPIIYVEFNVPQKNLDFNIHPEKREVLFLDQELMFGELVSKIKKTLENSPRQIETKSLQFKSSPITQKIIYTDPKNTSLLEIFQNFDEPKRKKVYNLEVLRNLRNEIIIIDSEFMLDTCYIGCFDDKILCQLYQNVILGDLRQILAEFYYQNLLKNIGNYAIKSVSITADVNLLSQKHQDFLSDYFLFKFSDDKILQIPSILKIDITSGIQNFLEEFSMQQMINEVDIFTFVLQHLAFIFTKNTVLSEPVYNHIKRQIAGTRKCLESWKILTTLKELYKIFER